MRELVVLSRVFGSPEARTRVVATGGGPSADDTVVGAELARRAGASLRRLAPARSSSWRR